MYDICYSTPGNTAYIYIMSSVATQNHIFCLYFWHPIINKNLEFSVHISVVGDFGACSPMNEAAEC